MQALQVPIDGPQTTGLVSRCEEGTAVYGTAQPECKPRAIAVRVAGPVRRARQKKGCNAALRAIHDEAPWAESGKYRKT